MLIAIFILIFICLIILSNYTIKYFKLKNALNKNDGPLRHGYYDYAMCKGEKNTTDYRVFTPRIYVTELEKYSNDMSKISLDKIEFMISNDIANHEKIEKFIKDNFTEIVNQNDITWLDIEKTLKQERKEKIKKIIKSKFF